MRTLLIFLTISLFSSCAYGAPRRLRNPKSHLENPSREKLLPIRKKMPETASNLVLREYGLKNGEVVVQFVLEDQQSYIRRLDFTLVDEDGFYIESASVGGPYFTFPQEDQSYGGGKTLRYYFEVSQEGWRKCDRVTVSAFWYPKT